jgi:peptidoglycan/LPS O-acetylase OafA/YrhL
LRQGWIGVDLFFVLSGYLITTILLRNRAQPDGEQPRFWRRFYLRRALRILPPLLVLLAASRLAIGAAPWAILFPYVVLFAANLGSLRYERAMMNAGLVMLWSLAVEEHFYLVWPLPVRWLNRRVLTGILLAVIVAEPLARYAVLVFGFNWKMAYYLTPFRLDGLALGCLLALALSSRANDATLRRLSPYALLVSAAATAACFPLLVFFAHTAFCCLAGDSLVAFTSAAALTYVLTHPQSLLARALAAEPLPFLGRISYGLYLYHLSIRNMLVGVANRHGYFRNERVAIVSAVVSLLAAWLSWRFYETPIMAWGRRRLGDRSPA